MKRTRFLVAISLILLLVPMAVMARDEIELGTDGRSGDPTGGDNSPHYTKIWPILPLIHTAGFEMKYSFILNPIYLHQNLVEFKAVVESQPGIRFDRDR